MELQSGDVVKTLIRDPYLTRGFIAQDAEVIDIKTLSATKVEALLKTEDERLIGSAIVPKTIPGVLGDVKLISRNVRMLKVEEPESWEQNKGMDLETATVSLGFEYTPPPPPEEPPP